jgi:hypothetical protein
MGHQWQSTAITSSRDWSASRFSDEGGNHGSSVAINGNHLLARLERISFLSKLAFLADGRWHRTLTQRDRVLPGTQPRLPTRLCTASEHVTNLSEGDESQRG